MPRRYPLTATTEVILPIPESEEIRLGIRGPSRIRERQRDEYARAQREAKVMRAKRERDRA